MKFEKILPCDPLKPYIRHFVVSEQEAAGSYTVFPSPGLVTGFQYRGKLAQLTAGTNAPLASAGITGITDRYRVFHNSADIGTILVYFTETGFAHFTRSPVHELFNQSTSLDNLFDPADLAETEDRLAGVSTDHERIRIVERFFLRQWKDIETDKLIVAAVRHIYASGGTMRIHELREMLCISASPFEKRFRRIVGTTPKKFASLVRFNNVLAAAEKAASLTELCYAHHFFDQAHFIRDFRQYTGESPEQYKRRL